MKHALERYESMRDFTLTPEPSGREHTGKKRADETRRRALPEGRSFVVQKHDARRLHYDFRLEHDGVLWSWAVPKGPSLSPGDKRLAVQTEDHPLDYRDFEGSIPEGQYGGGPVIVWDRGTWTPIGDPGEGMKRGRLDFDLDGDKLHGRFVLVRTRGLEGKKPSWLLIKRHDDHVTDTDIVASMPESVLTGRTIDDIRAGVLPKKPRAAAKKAKAPSKTARARAQSSTKKGASSKKSPKKKSVSELPAFASLNPELATLVSTVPVGDDWIYEIKYDGYRSMAWLADGKVQIASRRGLDWTAKYGPIAAALSRLRARSAIFDGEIAYVLEDGRTSFQKLQSALGGDEDASRLVYFIFDLLHYDGVDLRDEPLQIRREFLKTILAGEKFPLRLSGYVEDGEAFLQEVCRAGLEGIIGKRLDRPYRSGRSADWVKVKCHHRQEFVIVGFTPPKGTRRGIGALLLGVREGRKLRYAGKVGTGFSNATLKDLSAKLEPLRTDVPGIVNPPRMRDVRWVEPDLVAEVRFGDWTDDDVLRHPSFEGLRLDKRPADVHREVAVPAKSTPSMRRSPAPSRATSDDEPRVDGIVVTHPERVMDADSGLTKLDLARYAGEVAPAMFPFVDRRPLMLLRCPGGTAPAAVRQSDRRQGKKTNCFVQKHDGRGLQRIELGTDTLDGEEVIYVTEPKHLVSLAQNNTIEVHGWGSTLPAWDKPDWIVFDLDPDESLPFEQVIDAAFEFREALRTVHLESWVKTTGGKGLHVVVPIARRYDWTTVRLVSERIAVLMSAAAPGRYVAKMTKAERAGRIYIDYLRNAQGATAVLPYSARARPGLTVATPVSWDDLRAVNPAELTIVTVPKLLARRREDPWEDLFSTKQTLSRELVAAARR